MEEQVETEPAPTAGPPPWSQRGHFVRSFMTLGLAQLGTWLAGAAITVLVPRYLGDINLGKFSFAAATVNLIALLASLGTSTLVTRQVARDPAGARALAVNALVTRVPLSILAGLAVLAFAMVAVPDPMTRTMFTILSGGVLFGSLSDVSLAVLQGLHRMRALAVFSVATKVGYGVLSVAVLFLGGNAVHLVFVSVLVSVAGLGALLFMLHRRVGLWAPVSPRLMWTLLAGGVPFFVWQAALVVYGQIGVVLLSFMTRDAVVGWYSAAYKIVLMPGFLPVMAITVLFPAMSSAASKPAAFAQMARRALHYLVLLSVPMSVGMLLLADRIISFLHYPASFGNSVVPLAILSLHMPLVSVDMLIATILNARDRQRQWAMAGVAAAVLNPLLNIVAIRWSDASMGNGAIGGSVVAVLTEAFLLVMGLRLLPAGVFNGESMQGIARSLAASAVMAVAVWFLRPLPLPVAVAGGAACFTAAAFLFRAVTTDDVRQVVGGALARRRSPEAMADESHVPGVDDAY